MLGPNLMKFTVGEDKTTYLADFCLIVPLRLTIEVQESGTTVNGIVKRVNAPFPGLLAIRSITYLR